MIKKKKKSKVSIEVLNKIAEDVNKKKSKNKTKSKSKDDNKKDKKLEKAQKKLDEVVSSFQKDYGKLKKMIGVEAKDFQSDKANMAMLRSLLTMVIELIPLAEKNYRNYPSERGAYAIVALVNLARETANDIRNAQDLAQQVEYILSEIINPGLKQIVNQVINETYYIKKEMKLLSISNMNKKAIIKLINQLIKNQGSFIVETSKAIENRLKEYLT